MPWDSNVLFLAWCTWPQGYICRVMWTGEVSHAWSVHDFLQLGSPSLRTKSHSLATVSMSPGPYGLIFIVLGGAAGILCDDDRTAVDVTVLPDYRGACGVGWNGRLIKFFRAIYMPQAGPMRADNDDKKCISGKQAATCVAYSFARGVAAVGFSGGSVCLYSVCTNGPGLSNIQCGFRLEMPLRVLSGQDYPERFSTPVTCLAWPPCAPGGSALLAAGFEGQGLFVWATGGHKVASFSTADAGEMSFLSPWSNIWPLGVVWGYDGFYLFVAAKQCSRSVPSPCPFGESETRGSVHPGHPAYCGAGNPAMLLRFPITKACSFRLNGNRQDWAADSAILFGPGHLSTLGGVPWSPRILDWVQLDVPPDYVSARAPVRHVAVSLADGGKQIAVAGRRGFCVLNRQTGRWRKFGSILQEGGARPDDGLIWWDKSIIIVAHCHLVSSSGTSVVGDELAGVCAANGGKHELLLYPRDHLDSSSIIWRQPLPSQPLAMCANSTDNVARPQARDPIMRLRPQTSIHSGADTPWANNLGNEP